MKKQTIFMYITGLIIGGMAISLVILGNPSNMGFCIACFLRDTAGALKLHSASAVQYVRPEIIGLILGACVMSLITKEFKPRGGSSPILRFILAFFVMVGALMFLGCPLRMVLRLGGGDLNALVGLFGFIAGILVGVFFLKKGFTLRKNNAVSVAEGLAMPIISIILLVILLCFPSLLVFSESGPGSKTAPVILALAAGLIAGALAQKTRLCMVGGIRDAVLFKDFYLLAGFVGILIAVITGNIITQTFSVSFEGQAIAHTDGLWNFLGMMLVGTASVLIGGCPLRQLILAGSGNSDGGIAVLGMVTGAAFCHNFGLASSSEGPTQNGKTAVIIGFVVVLIIAVTNIKTDIDKQA